VQVYATVFIVGALLLLSWLLKSGVR